MTKNLLAYFIISFTTIYSLQAQANRYVVFFSDKINTPFTLNSPEQFLSSRALERRTRQGIALSEADLPVDPAYVAGVESTGAAVFFTSKWFNAALIQSDPALLSSIESLNYVDSVIYVAPGEKLTPRGRRHGPKSGDQLQAVTDKQLDMLGIDELQQEGFLGEGVLVAFFDGGFAGAESAAAFGSIYNSNRVLYTLNLIENDFNVYQHSDHGTKTLSITAGLLPETFEGSGYGADFMLFITEDATSEYRIEEYNWLIAAEKADSAGVDIINSSLGYFDFDDPSMNYTYEDMNGRTTIVTQAAVFAADRGMLVVTSAGNEGNNPWKFITAPADAENILSVGAVDVTGQLTSFSSVGPTADGRIKPEVVALGLGTALINANGTVTSGSGTSFSAPLITGLAAGLWQAYPHLTNMDLIALILKSGDKANNPGNQYGYGLPDYNYIRTHFANKSFVIYPNPLIAEELNIAQYSQLQPEVEAILYGPTGALIDKFQLRYSSLKDIQAISLGELQAGIYFLWLNADTVSQKFRIVKY